jgi:CRP/FNR family cyclic AMP-dependent transcriptional regulator
MDNRTLTVPTPAEVLDDEVLQVVVARGMVRQYPANAVLVNEDDLGDSLYVILRGRVKAYGVGDDGREVVYGTQGPGEYFGEMTLDGGPRSASVVTLEPTQCAVVPGPALRELLATHPPFAMHLVRKLIRLARASTEQVKSLALEDVYTRVARLLRRLAREEDGVPVVPEKLTQQDIADRVGASREMVSRVFKQLADGGYTGLRGGRIALLKKLPARW